MTTRYVALTTTSGREIHVAIPDHLTDEEVVERITAVDLPSLIGLEATPEVCEELREKLRRALGDPN